MCNCLNSFTFHDINTSSMNSCQITQSTRHCLSPSCDDVREWRVLGNGNLFWILNTIFSSCLNILVYNPLVLSIVLSFICFYFLFFSFFNIIFFSFLIHVTFFFINIAFQYIKNGGKSTMTTQLLCHFFIFRQMSNCLTCTVADKLRFICHKLTNRTHMVLGN